MARKRAQEPTSAARSISAVRAARMFRVISMLATGPKSRAVLLQRLKLNLRGFYRDLEKLRTFGIVLAFRDHRYSLCESLEQATTRLPFPDPRLNLREATLLAKGRTPAHRKLKGQIELITGKTPR